MIRGSTDNGDYLVQVSAQVMTRDDSTGGWVPMGGGGLSKVRLCKLSPLDSNTGNNNGVMSGENYRLKPEYVIQGERIADKTVILDCRLKKDIQYTKANPKWHHWKTDEKRYGLTFERSEDAKAFDQGIRFAVADLTDGMNDETAPDGDEYMELPLKRNDSSSRSASTTSTNTSSSPGTNSPQSPLNNNDPFSFSNTNANHLHRVHYISNNRASAHNVHTNGGGIVGQQQQSHVPGSPVSEKNSQHKSSFDSSSGQDEVWVRTSVDPASLSGKSDQGLIDYGDHGDLYKEESYVVFNKSKVGSLHEYSYPDLEPQQKPPSQRSSTKKQALSLSTNQTTQPYPPLPIKNKSKNKSNTGGGDGGKHEQSGAHRRLVSPQVQCKHCRELFSLEENPRGSCEDAPDSVERCIECVTCVTCTKGLMYHCWSDADGEFGHPCSCDPSDTSLCKRWTALTLLSLFLPCLWCYPPLKACHHCGILCGLCGGRHKAA
ncbi:sprouty-related EVH1 domain-containing protein 1-like isoform X1 [Biomphalaria pfeifferi]|uniref:Sprouty-related EVH1 domain-containing protein 1-like isoform X1 n=1 Tax=Biomphalaria pfeifferi TaxID=112525 RepID=A0AAD8BSM0_BIOPF|nr:sprouty-related EVH1 domain-containing protein 1-like isoform X1 [Biomphalaria pfeifferi]